MSASFCNFASKNWQIFYDKKDRQQTVIVLFAGRHARPESLTVPSCRQDRLGRFYQAFTPLYSEGMGAPAKDIRLMCGLLILKHVRNLLDESVVEQWPENVEKSVSVYCQDE